MFPRLRSFLTALTYRERFEDSLDEEVRFHLNAQTEDLASPRWGPAGGSGAPPEGAVRQHQSYEGRLPTGARPAGHGRAATEHPPDGLHGNPGTTPGCRPGRALPRTRESARWAPGGGGAASGSGPRRASPRASPRERSSVVGHAPLKSFLIRIDSGSIEGPAATPSSVAYGGSERASISSRDRLVWGQPVSPPRPVVASPRPAARFRSALMAGGTIRRRPPIRERSDAPRSGACSPERRRGTRPVRRPGAGLRPRGGLGGIRRSDRRCARRWRLDEVHPARALGQVDRILARSELRADP